VPLSGSWVRDGTRAPTSAAESANAPGSDEWSPPWS
jgi:hypothetical protein